MRYAAKLIWEEKKSANEDSLLVVKLGEVYLLAVADGLGGHAAGEVASRLALIEIEEFLKTNLAEGNLRDAMQGAIAKANREICLLSKENPAYAGMGTTLVAALVFDNRALIANIGDSRAYLIGNGIRQITRDHSLVQELVDREVIAAEEAFDHPQRNIVTRTLGMESEVSPDFYDEELSGRLLLLCSDGLSDLLRDQEILETVVASPNLDEACTRLINRVNEKGGKDNITVVLAREDGLDV
ncbi:Stp1/IreP family PP2C-type Ser/Thr phosphatase [Dehalococcoidia bacterium]|nr:Stp1/IreP family PP2C-type Ser/Thr phosphatase [Dehalococcoidia bacterium]